MTPGHTALIRMPLGAYSTAARSGWIATTAATGSPQSAAFATGLRRDHAAVTAGLSLPHSSGAVEGTVNKIKFLKGRMFGRADLDLLRIRVLHHR